MTADGRFRLCRGADPDKDQSYVLAMLGQDQLARSLFPVGEMTKAAGAGGGAPPRPAHRGQARQPGRLLHPLGRGPRGVPGRPARRCTRAGWSTTPPARTSAPVDAVELVTVGQRRGMGHSGDGRRRFVTAVDVPARRVTGRPARGGLRPRGGAAHGDLGRRRPHRRAGPAVGSGVPEAARIAVMAQCSAHGAAGRRPGCPAATGAWWCGSTAPQRRIAPGQTVALYDPGRPDEVVGSGIAR